MSFAEIASVEGKPVDPEPSVTIVEGQESGKPAASSSSLSSKLWLRISLVLLAATIILSCVSVVLMVRSSVQQVPQNRAAYSKKKCPFSEIFDYPLVCFISFESPVAGFTYDHIPTQLCRHVVLCCIKSDDNEEVTLATAKGFLLEIKSRRVKRYLGFGGPSLNYTNLHAKLTNDDLCAQLIKKLVKTMTGGHYHGGIALMWPDTIKITSPGLAQFFTKRLSKAMYIAGGPRKTLIVQLSTQPQHVKVTYTAEAFAPTDIIPMMTTHIPASRRPELLYATCASPYRSADPHHHIPSAKPNVHSVSSENALRELKNLYGKEWPDVHKEVMVSFSLAWLQFDHKQKFNRSAGTSAKYEGVMSYSDICLKTCSGPRHQRFRDEVTDCEVDWDGDRNWYSGLGERWGEFLRANRDTKGVGVFDVEYDDFEGVCRNFKFPQLQSVHDILREV